MTYLEWNLIMFIDWDLDHWKKSGLGGESVQTGARPHLIEGN